MKAEGPIVVALGGNAISQQDEEGNIPQQFRRTRQTVVWLANLIEAGRQIVVTHGNGPQVGNVLRRVELAAREVYTLTLDICGADTQGGMGYMIAQCLNNELRHRHVPRTVSVIVTMVEVAPDDPAFENPTKPIGGFYERPQAENMRQRYGWHMAEVAGGRLRRVVPSPIPRAIIEIELIRRLTQAGELLVVAGGGGIPVTRDDEGDLVGVEAVIDKDRTSALLAGAIDAETFVIATNVERVALDFGKPAQRFLDRMSLAEARRYSANGHFPPGSMGPKIEAAIAFLEQSQRGDARVIICQLERMADALAGRGGTHIGRE